jgi:hypothetical protein
LKVIKFAAHPDKISTAIQISTNLDPESPLTTVSSGWPEAIPRGAIRTRHRPGKGPSGPSQRCMDPDTAWLPGPDGQNTRSWTVHDDSSSYLMHDLGEHLGL